MEGSSHKSWNSITVKLPYACASPVSERKKTANIATTIAAMFIITLLLVAWRARSHRINIFKNACKDEVETIPLSILSSVAFISSGLPPLSTATGH